MKKAVKMTKTELGVFFLMAVLAGGIIGISGTASLLSINYFGDWGKLVGACLFSLGIYAIITYGMKLFTGMVADIPTLGIKNMWELPLCFLGNFIGIIAVGILVEHTPLAEKVIPQGSELIAAKLGAEGWHINTLCSSILCGALITLSVWAPKHAPKKELSASIEVILPIIVFAFCGFDHSVANMLYFFFYGKITWQIVAYVLISIIGNTIGGVIMPLVILLKEKSKDKE